MTNITKLYKQLQEGTVSKPYFMKIARGQFPQYISPVTSFDDTVKIFKSKRLISEITYSEQDTNRDQGSNWFTSFKHEVESLNTLDDSADYVIDQALRDAVKVDGGEEIKASYEHLNPKDAAKAFAIQAINDYNRKRSDSKSDYIKVPKHLSMKSESSSTSSDKVEVIKYVGKDTYEIKRPDGKISQVTFNEEEIVEVIDPPYAAIGYIQGEDGEYTYEMDADFVNAGGGDWDVEPDFTTIQATPKNNKASNQQLGMTENDSTNDAWTERFNDELMGRDLSPEEKAKAVKAMKALGSAELKDTYGMLQFPFNVNAFLGDVDDIVKMKGGQLNEAQKKEPTIEQVDYIQLTRGTEFEMSKMPVISDENYTKAKEKAYKNLVKDPNAYRHLSVANYKDVKKKDKTLQSQEVKKDNHTDKANEQKTIVKNVKPNTKDNLGKQEKAKKGTPEGVKLMKETATKKKLAEYERGDESDHMSNKEAAYYVADKIESQAEETYTKSELEDAFDAMEDKFGQRFSDKVFQAAVHILKTKGYNMVVKEASTTSDDLKQLRESMLKEFTAVPEQKKTFGAGHQVKTPSGKVGRIKDITQDNTATVELPDGTVEDYQVNVLKHDVPGEVFRRNASVDLKKLTKEEAKEKLVKSLKKDMEEGAIVATGKVGDATTQSIPVYSGPNVNTALQKAKQIKAGTKDPLKVIDTKTGKETQI